MNLVPPISSVLRTPAEPVQFILTQVVPHLAAMKTLMRDKGGVGLAAPQVGIGLQFFISTIPEARVVINPKVCAAFGNRISRLEGCLTWPGRKTYVPRFDMVRVEFTDRNGEQVSTILTGLPARIFQHETDHLNGVCIFSE